MKKILLVAVLLCASASSASFAADKYFIGTVPFLTQSPPGDWSHNMNCGPTATVMLNGYYTGASIGALDNQDLLDWLYAEKDISPQTNPEAEYYDGNATSVSILSDVLTSYFKLGGVVKKNTDDWEYLKKELDKGNPIIVGVNIQMNPAGLGHFMVLVGLTEYDDETKEAEVIFHDSGKTLGAFKKYSKSAFYSSWATSGYASLVVKRSRAHWFPEGTLLQSVGDNKVYVILNHQLSWIENEAIFNAHNFDWQKIIYVDKKMLACFEKGIDVDWSPYREVFSVGNEFYLMEKMSFEATTCTVYQFSSSLSYNSWNITGNGQSLTDEAAQKKYFSRCSPGGELYLRAGTLVKPNFNLAGYGAGVIFLTEGNGILHPFDSWRAFYSFGYENLPLLLAPEEKFADSYQSIGAPLSYEDSNQCLTGVITGGGGDEVIDEDGDGYSIADGDCDDTNSAIHPGAIELCDTIDNDCNGETDEGQETECTTNCGVGRHYCSNGHFNGCEVVTFNVEIDDGMDNDCDGLIDEGFDIPEGTDPRDVDNDHDGYTPNQGDCDDFEPTVNPGQVELCDLLDNDCDLLIDEDALCPGSAVCVSGQCVPTGPLSAKVECTISCPSDMRAYVWYGANGMLSGNTVNLSLSEYDICKRGQPWVDFNCACVFPAVWSCYDYTLATIECNQPIVVKKGEVDSSGEGEIWFTSFTCDQ